MRCDARLARASDGGRGAPGSVSRALLNERGCQQLESGTLLLHAWRPARLQAGGSARCVHSQDVNTHSPPLCCTGQRAHMLTHDGPVPRISLCRTVPEYQQKLCSSRGQPTRHVTRCERHAHLDRSCAISPGSTPWSTWPARMPTSAPLTPCSSRGLLAPRCSSQCPTCAAQPAPSGQACRRVSGPRGTRAGKPVARWTCQNGAGASDALACKRFIGPLHRHTGDLRRLLTAPHAYNTQVWAGLHSRRPVQQGQQTHTPIMSSTVPQPRVKARERCMYWRLRTGLQRCGGGHGAQRGCCGGWSIPCPMDSADD
jgi:hypothetical protein